MNSLQKGGKTKSSSSKSKKGGNFLGSVSELFVPTGWESFATTAGLFAIDRADAALRRKNEKSSVKKMSGGSEINLTHYLEISKTNRYLTNSFIRLYYKAFNFLDPNEARQLRELINIFITKEINYREKIYSGLRDDLKPLLANSINNLRDLQKYGNGDFETFEQYVIMMESLLPNINKSSFTKTLENISAIYSNKNKYPN
jgi:hypothetical protein